MSSNADRLSPLAAILILGTSVALMVWYATPQFFFNLYPVYELGSLIAQLIAQPLGGG